MPVAIGTSDGSTFPLTTLASESVTYIVSSFAMKIPVGLPQPGHSARNFPLGSNTCSRPLPRSPTMMRPCESIARQCGPRKSPGADPVFPNALTNLPSLENFTTREEQLAAFLSLQL